MRLRAEVAAALGRHGVLVQPDDSARSLHERLNDRYLDAVRAIRERQRSGEIARADYAARVQELRDEFSLLALPLALWEEPAG